MRSVKEHICHCYLLNPVTRMHKMCRIPCKRCGVTGNIDHPGHRVARQRLTNCFPTAARRVPRRLGGPAVPQFAVPQERATASTRTRGGSCGVAPPTASSGATSGGLLLDVGELKGSVSRFRRGPCCPTRRMTTPSRTTLTPKLRPRSSRPGRDHKLE